MPADEMSPRKVALFRAIHQKQILLDSMVLCVISAMPFSHQHLADIISAVTGWETGVVEQMQVAERILTAARLFNIREGLGVKDDILPERFFQPKTDGALSDKALDRKKLEQARRYYYTLMGWDPDTGVPLPERLEELNIT